MTASHERVERDVVRFLGEYAADAAAATIRPLAEYIARYPGSAEAIAREYLGLQEEPAAESMTPGLERFRILEEIARGGQGQVFLAEDLRLGRLVALKTLARAAWSQSNMERFRREAKAASRLNHPAICAIHDSGEVGDRAWIAMQYVPGTTLAQRIERGDLPPVAALLAYFEAVARALHAAHTAGIAHRDVKPSNLMVTPELQPVILDFGLASLGNDDATITRSGELMGTPAYMPPELLTGGLARAGAAGDIWSLAITMFEAMTGRRPFDGATREATFDAIRTQKLPDARRFNPGLPRELQTVLAVATDKDPDRRYASAQALAEDLRRLRCREPILARPPGAWVRLRRWTQRHPLVSALLALLALAAALAIDQAWRATAATALARRGERSARREAYFAQIASASAAIELRNPAHAASLLDGTLAELRGFEHAHLQARLAPVLAEHVDPEPLCTAAFGADGEVWFVRTRGELARFDLRTHAVTSAGLLGEPITGPARFSRDGRTLVAVVGADADQLAWFDLAAGTARARLSPGVGRITALAIDPRTSLAAVGGVRAVLCRLDASSAPTPLLEFRAEDFSFSRDGGRLACAYSLPAPDSGEGWMLDYDVVAGRARGPAVRFSERIVRAIDAGDDGGLVASGCDDRQVRLHVPAERRCLQTLGGHIGPIRCVALEPGQRRIATAAADRTVRVWDVKLGLLRELLTGARAVPRALAFSGDGELLLGHGERELWVWKLGGASATGVLHGHRTFVYGVAHAEHGRRIVSGGWDTEVRIWDAASESCIGVLRPGAGIVLGLATAAEAARAATAHDGSVRVWNLDTGQQEAVVLADPPQRVNAVWLAADGSWLLARTQGLLRQFTVPGGELVWTASAVSVHLNNRIAVSPDGAWVAVDGPQRSASIWRFGAAAPHAELRCSHLVTALAFTPDGRGLLTGTKDGTVALWRVGSWTRVWQRSLHAGAVYALCTTPDGLRVVSGSEDTTAVISDVASGQPALLLQGHSDYVYALSCSPDGGTLVTGSGDGTVRTWHAVPGQQRGARAAQMRVAHDQAVAQLAALGTAPPAELAARVRADTALGADLREAMLQQILARALR